MVIIVKQRTSLCKFISFKIILFLNFFYDSYFRCKAQGYAFYFTTILPAVVLVLFTLATMIISMVYIYKSQCNQVVTKNQNDQCRIKLRRKIKLFLGLLIMAVLGWGPAVAATDENTPLSLLIVFYVLFLLFGSGQGFYLFFFACVFSSSVRRDWKEVVLCAVRLSVKTVKNRISSSTASTDTDVGTQAASV